MEPTASTPQTETLETPRIVRTPGVCGGRPRIDGHRITVEHVAVWHEQMGMMVSGRLEFTVDDTTRVLGPGDIWRIPGRVVHRVRAFEEPAVALDVFHPIREDYL